VEAKGGSGGIYKISLSKNIGENCDQAGDVCSIYSNYSVLRGNLCSFINKHILFRVFKTVFTMEGNPAAKAESKGENGSTGNSRVRVNRQGFDGIG
jgi:hypothetical protein